MRNKIVTFKRTLFLGLTASFFSIFLISGFVPSVFSDIDLNDLAGVKKTEGLGGERETLPSDKNAYFFIFNGNGGGNFGGWEEIWDFIQDNGGIGHIGAWNNMDRKDSKYHTFGIDEDCAGETCNWSKTLSQMESVLDELKKQKLDNSNAKLFLIGSSFGGGAVSMIVSEIDDVDYDLVWIIDPVANGGFRKSVMRDCGATFQSVLDGCPLTSPKRSFNNNIKNFIINYQTDDQNPRDQDNRAFYPDKWDIASDISTTIKEYDQCEPDIDSVKEVIKYRTKKITEKVNSYKECYDDYKYKPVSLAKCLAEEVTKEIKESYTVSETLTTEGENCHNSIGKLTEEMDIEKKGWGFYQ